MQKCLDIDLDLDIAYTIEDIKFVCFKFMTPLRLEHVSDRSLLKLSLSIQLFMKTPIKKALVSLKTRSKNDLQ